MVLPYALDVEEHMVFQTEGPDALGRETYTWIVSRYEPIRAFIEYTVFTTTRVWWIAIQCEEHPAAPGTRATICYTYLGLTEDGNRRNEAALGAMFHADLKDWEAALNHYLETGERLRGTDSSSA